MRRVLYIVPGLDPSYKDGASNRVNSFINCFIDGGYEVIVAPLTHYNKYIDVYKKRRNFSTNAKWIIIPHIFFKRRWMNLYSYIEKLILLILTIWYRCDIVLADYATGGELASWTKLKAKLIVNHRGDIIDEYKHTRNTHKEDSLVKSLKHYIRRAIKNADMSICVSENLRKELMKQSGLELNNTFIYPCCADITRFENVICPKNEEKIVVGYFGGFNKWQCINTILDIFVELRKKDKRFFLMLITNSSPELYKEKLDEIGKENYSFKGVPFNEIPENISKMDASFALRENRPLNIVSSPTKLSESLAAGVPIIVTKASGDYAEMLIQNQNGLCIESVDYTSEDIENIYRFLLYVKENRKEVFETCRTSVRKRTWNNYSNSFHKFLEERL
jgi:glycosyltransferase involved in cell wall biosynthesis